jgi:hypothetical protein
MSATVHSFAAARSARAAKAAEPRQLPAWSTDVVECCLRARVIKTEHEAEQARIDLERHQRGITLAWRDTPKDLQDRIDANNIEWEIYGAMIRHLAALPTSNRREARMKRTTIGKIWLRPSTRDDGDGGVSWIAALRDGCIADDHHFPPSERLGRATKGECT